MSYLDELVESKLGGDESRILELFESSEILNELITNEKPGDWYRFSEATYDGEYLQKHGVQYICYQQDRGVKFGQRHFSTLQKAAASLFHVSK